VDEASPVAVDAESPVGVAFAGAALVVAELPPEVRESVL
jgi:hypothetical protein